MELLLIIPIFILLVAAMYFLFDVFSWLLFHCFDISFVKYWKEKHGDAQE